MPLAEFLENSTPATAAQLRKQVFLQFGAIIALGLALTGWYVGFRIHSERPTLPPPVPVKRAQIAVPTAKPIVIPVPVEPRPVEIAARPESFRRRDASPRSGEKYLQIAAFGPRALDGYLKKLESRGLHPVVAPGPVDSIYRILMGPFPNPAALEEARRSIKASGIEPILRVY